MTAQMAQWLSTKSFGVGIEFGGTSKPLLNAPPPKKNKKTLVAMGSMEVISIICFYQDLFRSTWSPQKG